MGRQEQCLSPNAKLDAAWLRFSVIATGGLMRKQILMFTQTLSVLFGFALLSTASQAATVSYSTLAAWNTAVGSALVDIQTFTISSPNQQLVKGVVNSVGGIVNVVYTRDGTGDENSDFINATADRLHLAWDNSATDADGQTLTLQLTFDNPITAFAADVTTLDLGSLTGLKLKVDGDSTLYSLPTGAENFTGFFGLTSDTPFSSMSFIDDGIPANGTGAGATSRRFALDNVRTVSVVPAPPAAWLLASALVAMVGLGRRKQA